MSLLVTWGLGYEASASQYAGETIDVGLITNNQITVSLSTDEISISIDVNNDEVDVEVS